MTSIEIFGITIFAIGMIGLLILGISEIINTIRKTNYYKYKVINTLLENLHNAKSLQEIIDEIEDKKN